MKYGPFTMVALVLAILALMLSGGCRSSTTAQAQGPAMTPAEVGAALTEQLELVLDERSISDRQK